MAAKAQEKGDKAFSDRKYVVAEKHFTKAIGRLLVKRSKTRAFLKRTNDALSDAKMAVDLYPTWGKGYACLAAAHLRVGNRKLAIESYNNGLNIDPRNVALRSGLAAVRTPKEIQRAIRKWETRDLSVQPGNDCWEISISNMVKMMARILYNENITPDMSEIRRVFENGSDDSSSNVELRQVLDHVNHRGILIGPGRYIYPIIEVIDVSCDKYDSDKIRSHIKEHGALLVSFPISRAYSEQIHGRWDVQDLTHLQEELLALREETRGQLASNDYKYLEEARKKEKRMVKKNDNYFIHHCAILFGEKGDAWLVKNFYEEGFGRRNVVKLKVIFEEIIVLKWREPGSPDLH